MGALGEAYAQGGAVLVLMLFAGGALRYLLSENRKLQESNDELRKAGDELLRRYQDRDQEELRGFREEALRRRSGTSPQ